MGSNFIKKYIYLITFFLLTSILLGGCWSHRELNEIGIVSGMGLDLTEEGKIAVTVQVITPSPFNNQSSKGEREPVRVITSEGETVFDAIRNLTSKSGDRIFHPHNQVYVFGEELARAGVQPVLDFLERDPEIRIMTWIILTEGKAEDVIRGRSSEDDIPTNHINRLIEDYRSTSKIVPTSLLTFITKLLKEGVEPTVGKLSYSEVKGEPIFFMEGGGVFKGDRLVDWLDPYEARGLLWVEGLVESGIVVVERKNIDKKGNKGKGGFEDKISFEIVKSKSKVKPILNEDDLSILIELQVLANIGERMDHQVAEGREFIRELEELLSLEVKKEVEHIVAKAQKKYKSDILGFGLATHRKFPEYWRENKEEWDEIFTELDVEVKVKSRINARGMIK